MRTSRAHLFVFAAVLASLPLPGSAAAEVSATLEGRVVNAATGSALPNARIVIEGTARQTVADESGRYRLAGVPAGQVRINVNYVGMERQTVAIELPGGAVTTRDFELVREAVDSSIVQLAAVEVVGNVIKTAQELADNERRNAANIKQVVATDEYGDRGLENAAEYFQFLPGLAVSPGSIGPGTPSMRGFPSELTEVTIDGGPVIGARDPESRSSVSFETMPMVNISRIEVTKVPTPDMPAAGLGGTINLISRSGFEMPRPSFSYQVSTTFNSQLGYTLKVPRYHLPQNSFGHVEPNYNLNYRGPVTKSIAITAGYSSNWRLMPAEDGFHTLDSNPSWDQVNGIQTSSLWYSKPLHIEGDSAQLGLDWRISDRDLLTVGFNYKTNSQFVTRDYFRAQYGNGATGDATHTHGAPSGVGNVTTGIGPGYNDNASVHNQYTLKYRHRGELWDIEAGGSFSNARGRLKDIDHGYFRQVQATITNLIVHGDDIRFGEIPSRYSAWTRTGDPVDIYDTANYSIVNATSQQSRNKSTRGTARLDVTRRFSTPHVPFTLKSGISMDRSQRDQRENTLTWNFRPNGATSVAARMAGNFDVFDPNYESQGIYGVPFRTISHKMVYDLYRENPDWFVLDEPAAYQSMASSSKLMIETISAAYLRADARLFKDRLWLVGGVRFEKTEVEGSGPLNDINAQYQRDANGNFILDGSGKKILITTDALELRKLRFQERAAHADSSYSGFYPSLNATYEITDSLLIRAAYARTLGRPNVSFVIPGLTISDPDATNPLITITNPELEPWTADNFDLSFETYNIKGGTGSISVFQKNVENFFILEDTPATPELLGVYDLPTDGSFDHYDIRTRRNAEGTARIRGLEISYRQSLDPFLPHWARGLQVHGNMTKMSIGGEASSNLEPTPLKYTLGINFLRPKYFVRLNYVYQDEKRTNLVNPSATIRPDTYNYNTGFERLAFNAEYSFRPWLSVFVSMPDMSRRALPNKRYAPDTPDYARFTRGYIIARETTIGIKGRF